MIKDHQKTLEGSLDNLNKEALKVGCNNEVFNKKIARRNKQKSTWGDCPN